MDLKRFEILGLTPQEARIFQTLHRIGQAPASSLARSTNINRSCVYEVLQNMIDKNLVSKFKEGRYTYFALNNPEVLLIQQRNKLKIAEDLIKELNKFRPHRNGIEINYYRGTEGVREIYQDIFKHDPPELMWITNLDIFQQIIDIKRNNEWIRERINRKIYSRLIVQDSPTARQLKENDQYSLREIRIADKNFKYLSSCLIYRDYIVLFESKDEISGIRIHTPSLFNLHKQFFEMAWTGMDKKPADTKPSTNDL